MRVLPGGKTARTSYRVVGRARHVSLVALFPRTGRTHQLRVQLAHVGHPIVGDDLYGGPRERGVRDGHLRRVLESERALLHAWRVELPGIEPGRFESDLPRDFSERLRELGLALPADLWQSFDVNWSLSIPSFSHPTLP